jgi:probable addiction module antidote protein
MSNRSVPYEEDLYRALRNPAEAEAYINAALADGDIKVFLLALRDVIEAQSSVASIAKETKLNRENLYRILSDAGNPTISSLITILDALGLSLTVRSIQK